MLFNIFVFHRAITCAFFSQSPFMRKAFAILLSVSFLFVTTALTQTLTTHLQHVGHDQQTHEQTWCSWSCQAGHGIHVLTIFVEGSARTLSLLDLPSPKIPYLNFINNPTSRGPPVLFK